MNNGSAGGGRLLDGNALFETIASSSTGAIITALLMTPMDVVKIRLQQQIKPLTTGECFIYSNGLMDHLCSACAQSAKNIPCEWYQRPNYFNGTVDAFVKIARYEGVRSLWSGLSPTLVMAIPATVFYFSTYDLLKKLLQQREFSGVAVPLLAGGLSRTIAVTVVSPLELIRTKMQSEKMSAVEVGQAIRNSIAAHGWIGLYLGWAPTLLRDVPFSAIYWSVVEVVRARLIRWTNRTESHIGLSALAGATGGTIAAICTQPFDVVKTKRQILLGTAIATGKAAPETGVISVMRQVMSTGGWRALWAGLAPRIAKVSAGCAIMLGTYDHLKLYFARRKLPLK
ncbi:unnamed protein product, partial [Mesorhabditis spiculigera]